ncbi:MAG: hypothetical protein JNL67_23020 [Planctomycetaceae bacterium]|nr:hypothetical protein [Planctomycetaceae bacterium]
MNSNQDRPFLSGPPTTPLHFLEFAYGLNYYLSGCCTPQAPGEHFGVIVSYEELKLLGCAAAGPVSGPMTEEVVLPPSVGVATPCVSGEIMAGNVKVNRILGNGNIFNAIGVHSYGRIGSGVEFENREQNRKLVRIKHNRAFIGTCFWLRKCKVNTVIDSQRIMAEFYLAHTASDGTNCSSVRETITLDLCSKSPEYRINEQGITKIIKAERLITGSFSMAGSNHELMIVNEIP